MLKTQSQNSSSYNNLRYICTYCVSTIVLNDLINILFIKDLYMFLDVFWRWKTYYMQSARLEVTFSLKNEKILSEELCCI